MDLFELVAESFREKLVRIQTDPSQNTNYHERFHQDTQTYDATLLDADNKPKAEKVGVPIDQLGIVSEVLNENRSQTQLNILFGDKLVQLSMIEVEVLEDD